ncbi:MAG: RraA family protein [Armatimonadetes bacterium]|nr:RraA family protein [Armatimonadota bacterium]
MKMTDSDTVRAITSVWQGERDGSGRPLVPDDILKRMDLVTTEEAWGVLRRNGYNHQFSGNWTTLHPSSVLVGRAVTCRWVPRRPDVHESIDSQGETDGRIGFQNSWVIDELAEGDVLVVDLFGKVRDGTFAGDNLATAIQQSTHRGLVVDGGVRDVQRMMELEDFNAFTRGYDPTAIFDVSMVAINAVTRIGEATVVPGDVVLGTLEGIIFIPPHLAEEVVTRSEQVRLKDEFGQQRIREGVYTPGEVDREFSDAMNRDFDEWKAQKQRDG